MVEPVLFSSMTETDLPAVQVLLTDCRLPIDGIEFLMDHCLVAKVGSRLVGTIALEVCGRSGLLRSLAVAQRRSWSADVGGVFGAHHADLLRGGAACPL